MFCLPRDQKRYRMEGYWHHIARRPQHREPSMEKAKAIKGKEKAKKVLMVEEKVEKVVEVIVTE